jgi:hypothetical protein
MGETLHGYVKWGNRKIVRSAIWRVVERPTLNREEMGETDANNWPISDMTGKVEDPYQHVISIPLVSLDATSVFTFSTHYYYGREAAYGLLRRYAEQGAQHPGEYPIIELGTVTQPTKRSDIPVADPGNCWLDRPATDHGQIRR